ncbi:hypothetical protein FHX42_001654 [Saccharopolyspora lacisalsi]|uniref:DUF4383 domain-containing protein n=1 Tax=Halosaccharopolyspora lacisalsi TaxID=1000566 RepID=A0A839DXX7_9PSEU|nr:DUF4383 domain-containing protein [Halosaccharopolyspora lacisalsi]MBA8824307.1 hypothetical protein [Halosaccharopolyspora lacisalsi]
MEERKPRQHPVHVVHRVSAAVLGLGLWVFAGLGFAHGLRFLTTEGQTVLGLSSNGLLSTISVVAGALLLGAAFWGGPVASMVTGVLGALFLLSGIVHLGVLHTELNILAFRLSNVFFSLIVGMLLLFVGLYGRVSGGLPPDNPYRQAHPRRKDRPLPQEQEQEQDAPEDENEQRLEEAELAMGEGHATPEQTALVEHDQAKRREKEYDRAYRHLAEDQPETPHGTRGE